MRAYYLISSIEVSDPSVLQVERIKVEDKKALIRLLQDNPRRGLQLILSEKEWNKGKDRCKQYKNVMHQIKKANWWMK